VTWKDRTPKEENWWNGSSIGVADASNGDEISDRFTATLPTTSL